MGLIKDALEAIIRIDRNLAEIRKALVWHGNPRSFQTKYPQETIEQVRADLNRKPENELPLFDRLPQLEIFPYPSNLTLGGRFTAVRKFHRLNQYDIATALDVTPSYVSRIEADKVIPSATIIRFFALNYNINERWLATGHLPQTTEEPATPIHLGKIVPLSGYGDADALQSHINLQHQTRLEVEHQMVEQKDPVLQRLREVDYRKEPERADPTRDERQDG